VVDVPGAGVDVYCTGDEPLESTITEARPASRGTPEASSDLLDTDIIGAIASGEISDPECKTAVSRGVCNGSTED
jgi:hypothetical protein